MHEFAFFNCIPVPADAAAVSALSSAALYGRGIFTTIAIFDGTPFLWDMHWRRVNENGARVCIDLGDFSETRTKKALDEIILVNQVHNGRARLTFFDESSGNLWPFKTRSRTSLLLTTGDLRTVPDNFRITASLYQVNSASPLTGIKSCNYLEKLMALDEARSRGFNEAIQVNERSEVASAVMANVFWLKGETLYTPSLKTGCLAGATREFVLENLECREVVAGIDELHSADAIFVTSAGLGIVPVSEWDDKRFATPFHPVTDLISVIRGA